MSQNQNEMTCPDLPTRQLLTNQVAIVTGASSGIGKATAMELAAAGAKVCINYYSDTEEAQGVLDEIEGKGGTAFIHQADISKEPEVIAMFEATRAKYGWIDILVNNAGIQKDAPIDEMTLEQWDRVIGTNLTGQFLCSREAIREFKQKGINPEVSCAAGKIICISSVHEVIPWAGHANYAASKGGVLMMMKSIAQEIAPLKIRVNSICPGAIRTPINTNAWETEAAYSELIKLIPARRIGEPLEIGRAAVWLASDDSDYINGISLFIDGGMTLYPGFATGG